MAVDQARFPLYRREKEMTELITQPPKTPPEQPKHGWQHGQNGVKPETLISKRRELSR